MLASTALSWGTLCLGEDGHVAFEISVAGRCFDDVDPTPPFDHPVHLNACDQEAGCGPCTDFCGTADGWLASATLDSPDKGPLVFVAHAAIPQTLPAMTSPRLGDVTAAARHAKTAMTVLRC
jgi:hypothetical protein